MMENGTGGHSALQMANSYTQLHRTRMEVMSLARKVDTYAHDADVLRMSGDHAAAAGACRLLQRTMVALASTPAHSARQLARKVRALEPTRIVASGLSDMAVDVIAAGLAAERAIIEGVEGTPANAADRVNPAAARAYAKNANAGPLAEVLRRHSGLLHDHRYLLREGRNERAERLAAQITLDLLRPASRAALTVEEAGTKLALIEASNVGSPLLRAMLAAVATLERAKWGFRDAACVLNELPPTSFPGEEERCKQYEGALDPTQASPFVARAEAIWSDYESLRTGGGAAAEGCFYNLLDVGLMAAAIPARDRSEAERKAEFASELFHLFGGDTYPGVMLKAALAFECAQWGIQLADPSERPLVRH